MKTLLKMKPAICNDIHIEFTPSKEQINMLAHRLMPEIKKYFANEQVRKEFEKWMVKQKMA